MRTAPAISVPSSAGLLLVLAATLAAPQEPALLVDAIAVRDKDVIWSTTSPPGVLRRSRDGGRTWKEVLVTKASALAGVGFFGEADEHVLVVTAEGRVLRSADGGADFSAVSDVRLGESVRRLAVHPSGRALAVGTRRTLQVSDDRGRSWRDRAPEGLQGTLYGVAFAGESAAFAVGDRGLILRSDDGGDRWTVSPAATERTLFAVAFGDEARGACVGAGGVVLVTDDAGATWAARPVDGAPTLYGVARFGAAGIVVCGRQGALHRSNDAGRSWRRIALDADKSAIDLHTLTVHAGRLHVGGTEQQFFAVDLD